jgi:hypothetical protein
LVHGKPKARDFSVATDGIDIEVGSWKEEGAEGREVELVCCSSTEGGPKAADLGIEVNFLFWS